MSASPSAAARPAASRAAAGDASKLPGILAGIGLGGFVDGIVFHQLLQWHHFVSSTERGAPGTLGALEHNTFWDGVFHVATWWVTAAAVYFTWQAWRRGALAPPWRTYLGWMLVGWGGFDVFDGVVLHLIAAIHHLRDDVDESIPWDIGYIVAGLLLIALGLWLVKSGRRDAGDRGAAR